MLGIAAKVCVFPTLDGAAEECPAALASLAAVVEMFASWAAADPAAAAVVTFYHNDFFFRAESKARV